MARPIGQIRYVFTSEYLLQKIGDRESVIWKVARATFHPLFLGVTALSAYFFPLSRLRVSPIKSIFGLACIGGAFALRFFGLTTQFFPPKTGALSQIWGMYEKILWNSDFGYYEIGTDRLILRLGFSGVKDQYFIEVNFSQKPLVYSIYHKNTERNALPDTLKGWKRGEDPHANDRSMLSGGYKIWPEKGNRSIEAQLKEIRYAAWRLG